GAVRRCSIDRGTSKTQSCDDQHGIAKPIRGHVPCSFDVERFDSNRTIQTRIIAWRGVEATIHLRKICKFAAPTRAREQPSTCEPCPPRQGKWRNRGAYHGRQDYRTVRGFFLGGQ